VLAHRHEKRLDLLAREPAKENPMEDPLTAEIGEDGGEGMAPVEFDVAVDGRMPAPVESAAYFTVAEALTNVTKYARASVARVEIARDGDAVLVVVADDGVGGVDLAAGSGLRGLRDRLNAVDGTLEIDSPPGAGTRLTARIPCDRVTPQRPPAPRQEAEA